MKTFRWIANVALFTLSFPAFAEPFAGRWIGTGQWNDLDGVHGGPCPTMLWQFEQTENTFTVAKSEFLCEPSRKFGWDVMEFEIRDGELSYGSLPLGTFQKNKIEMSFMGAGVSWQVSFEIKEGQLLYQELERAHGSGIFWMGTFSRDAADGLR